MLLVFRNLVRVSIKGVIEIVGFEWKGFGNCWILLFIGDFLCFWFERELFFLNIGIGGLVS